MDRPAGSPVTHNRTHASTHDVRDMRAVLVALLVEQREIRVRVAAVVLELDDGDRRAERHLAERALRHVVQLANGVGNVVAQTRRECLLETQTIATHATTLA
jgi:hypothetical protein